MNGHKLSLLAAVISLVVSFTACESPPERTAATLSELTLLVQETVKERAVAYPDAVVTDIRANDRLFAACGLVRSEGRQPHVMLAMKDRDDDGWSVSTPYMHEQGAWESDSNALLSLNRNKTCKILGLGVDESVIGGLTRK